MSVKIVHNNFIGIRIAGIGQIVQAAALREAHARKGGGFLVLFSRLSA